MKALTYIERGKFALTDKPKPEIIDPRDAIVRVTLGSICTSDLHIKHGSVPRAVPGITVGHEMVGVVESVGSGVASVRPGDRVTVNVETFCGDCFFCRKGYVNNCTDPNGGWALGCRIDGGQTEFVRVPYADQGLNRIPDSVSDEQALFVGDVLATGFWAARISEISEEDTVLIIGAGPTGICTLLCVMLKKPKRIIICEKDPVRMAFVREHYPEVLLCTPETCQSFVMAYSDHGGADVVLEVAGANDTFELAWRCARPNAIVTVVALYDEAQFLPLPDMYGKNLIFKTGGVDGCDCAEILQLIEARKIDTTPLITHRFPLDDIEEAYRIFENKLDGVIKIAIEPAEKIPTTEKASDIVRTKLQRSGGHATVHSVNGKAYEINACSDGRSFHCDQLPITPPYTYEVFDVMTDCLTRQGGKAAKGCGRNAKLGEPRCEDTTLVGAIGKYYAGKRDGESVFDPVFVLAAILEWADIAHNRRGFLELTANYRRRIYL